MPKKTFIQNVVIIALLCGVGLSLFGPIKRVFAAALTTLSDTQSSLRVSTLSDHTIQFVTPTGIAAGQGISVTFPAGYATGTFNVNNFDFATSTSATCSGFTDAPLAASPAGLTWGVAVSTATLYITSGTAVVPANRCVQIRIGSNAISQASGTSVITNPAAAGPYAILIAGSFGDNGSITQNIITNDTVSVSATVQQSITFTISTTTIYFGPLSSASAKYASSTNPSGDSLENIAHTLAVSTNAPSGYNVSVRGQTLTNQQATSSTITAIGAAIATSTPGTEQFGLRATVAGGTGGVVDATFASTTAYGFDATATTSAPLAVGTVSTNVTTYSLRYLANIAGTTEAGTYVANLVYVATANF
jgi:hypothetical protein